MTPAEPSDAVVPKPAATVLLLRDDPAPPAGTTPLQVFLQRRVKGMAFAGGMTVFPGGGVASDDEEAPRWTGPDTAWWGERLGLEAALAGAIITAAVRETFEECGVLLAGSADADPLPDVLGSARDDLVTRRRTLADVLDTAGLPLRADLLHPWARWITPPRNDRRYDTIFLAARVPAGQSADAHTTEAVEAGWWHPAMALASWQAGDMQLMPPTFRTLEEIAAYPDAVSVLAAAGGRSLAPIMPLVRRDDDGAIRVVLPGDPGYTSLPDNLTPGGTTR